jgi:sugar porter (SP) family MFS transporter
MGVGTISVLVPLYQSEMAPKWIRGALVCVYQLAITVGLLVASIVSNFTSAIDGPACFRIPVALQFVWAGILFLGLVILPETPRYLIKRGRHEEAAQALSRIRRLDITHPALQDEIAEIQANHAYELSLGPSTYKDAFLGSPHLGRRLLTGCGLQMLQQLSGCNFVFYYGVTFFKHAGISSPFLYSLITNIVNVVATVPGMVLVESWGRRRLLLFGCAGMAVSQFIVASVGTAYHDSASLLWNKVLIAFVCLYIAFFATSWGPVAWVVTSEIYPLKVRAKSMSISTASNWLFNWAIAYATPYMVGEGEGYADLQAKVFFVWGSCCVLAFAFVYFMVYETSKISLEQIDEMYERVEHAWHSARFEPSWSFQDIQENDGVTQASGVSMGERQGEAARRRNGAAVSAAAAGAGVLIPGAAAVAGHALGQDHDPDRDHGITPTTSGSSNAQSEEDKIIASLGDVNFDY